MAHYAVRESPPLRGEIPIGTSKNAVLPIMCGALLTDGDVRIENPPDLTDVTTLCSLLGACGSRILWVYLILPLDRTLVNLFWSYPVSWALTFAVQFAAYFIVKHRMKKNGTFDDEVPA